MLPKLASDLHAQLVDDDYADVVLVLRAPRSDGSGGHTEVEVTAHRFVLAARCPYFARRLAAPGRRKGGRRQRRSSHPYPNQKARVHCLSLAGQVRGRTCLGFVFLTIGAIRVCVCI